MKVDLGQCAVCGAKNSKYVERCYKCGATLPWAPDYVATQNNDRTDDKPVVITPAEAKPIDAPKPRVSRGAHSKVALPVWALFAGGVGLLALGMALWAILDREPRTKTIAPAPAATAPALAPLAPTASVTPDAQQMGAAKPANSGEVGPNFDELYANLTTGTPQQRALYWESVKGKRINWRGEFVSLGNAAAGPLVVNCKSTKAFQITVKLDTTTPQTLPAYNRGQSLPFSGVLESWNRSYITVNDGRVE